MANDDFGELVESLAALLGALLVFLLGFQFLAGLPGLGGGVLGLNSQQSIFVLAVGVTLLYIVAKSRAALSFPFVLSLVAVGAVILKYVMPDAVMAALPLGALGLEPTKWGAAQILVLSTLAIFTYWIIQIRSEKTSASSTARELFGSGRGEKAGEVTKLFEEYVTIGRFVVGSLVATVVTIIAAGGDIFLIIGDAFLQDPLISSNLVTAAVAFFTAGGEVPGPLQEVPILGDIASMFSGAPPGAVLVFILLLVGMAYAIREQYRDEQRKAANARAKKREFKKKAEQNE